MSLLSALKLPRIRMAVGMTCLAIGITFPYFAHPAAPLALRLVHFGRGLLIGFSLVMVLSSWRWPAPRERGSAT